MLFIATQIGEICCFACIIYQHQGPLEPYDTRPWHVVAISAQRNIDCIERYKRRAGNSAQLKEAENRLSQFDARSLSPHTFEDYIIERGVAVNILGLFYENIVFRKWRRRTQIGAQRDHTKLARILRNKFGRNPVLVVGNTSIKSARFHPSTLGVGLRSALRRQGFKILLIDEFRTSRNCPECHTAVENFRYRKSPRPWRRHLPEQEIHGLLRCNSQQCQIQGCPRYYNRDLLAVLNFRRIYSHLARGLHRPMDLRRTVTNDE